jgi:hypothetical protein
LDALQTSLSGDVKKLAATTHEYRLRVGTLRVLFTLESDLISGRHMGEAATKVKKPTLKSLAAEICRLRERLEDVEDLIELRGAIERNAGRPGVPWGRVKAELDLE